VKNVRPSDARRQKLHPDGTVPANFGTPGGGTSLNATATGRRVKPRSDEICFSSDR